MSTKLVFTAHSVSLCEQIVDSLRSLGVTDESISVVASDQTPLPSLPDADLLENDVVPAIQRGGAVGALTGVVAGLGMAFAVPGFVVGGAGLALAALGGASFGALASGLIGASVPNSHLQEYQDALAEGSLLLIAQVHDDHEQSIKRTLLLQYPTLNLEEELPRTAYVK